MPLNLPNPWKEEEQSGITHRRRKPLYAVERSTPKAYDLTMGTALVGTINTSYNKLERLFGKPSHDGDGYKIDVEWVIVFGSNHDVCTIYNYKDGKNYLGSAGLPVSGIKEWHVGAHSSNIGITTKLKKFFNSIELDFNSAWR